jgi:tetratricopeptide (TPR) repeat protein
MARERKVRATLAQTLLAASLLTARLNLFSPLPAGCDEGAGSGNSGAAERSPGLDFKIDRAGSVKKTPGYYDALADAELQKYDWPAACRIYDEAVLAFPGDKRLLNNAAVARDRWASAEQARGRWSEALEPCANALARGLYPDQFKKRVVVIVRAGGREFLRNRDWAGLSAWLKDVRARFPDAAYVTEIIPELYTEALDGLSLEDEQDYIRQGTLLLRGLQELQATSSPDVGRGRNWCNRLLAKLQARRAWEDGLAFMQEARDLLPQDVVLRDQEIAIWNKWAKEYSERGEWNLAAVVYEQALERFPQEKLFLNNLKICQKKHEK